MKRLVFFFFLTLLAISILTLSANAQKGYKIALSNSFYGNTWRKQMVDVMQKAANEAKAQGLISDFIIDNGDGTVNTQLSQLSSLILSHPDAILINAASPTALNGAIAQAVQQGIKVVVFDSLTTSTDAYQIAYDNSSWGEIATNCVVKRLGPKGGNVLLTRGVVGSQPEQLQYEAIMKILKQHPEIHVLGEVDTEADNARAQSAVANLLPSMPQIDAVSNEGSYGVVQAFLAAGRPVPLVVGNNRAEFIRWWIEEKAKNGYETISLGTEPSIGVDTLTDRLPPVRSRLLSRLISPSERLPVSVTSFLMAVWRRYGSTAISLKWRISGTGLTRASRPTARLCGYLFRLRCA
jgi:ribose transport system substrate-binding protein